MKLTSRQNTQLATAILFLLLAVVFSLIMVRNKHRQSSIESGRFEAHYTSVMNDLRASTRSLQEKLADGSARHLKIVPEDQIIKPKAPEPVKVEPEPETGDEQVTGTIQLKGIYWSQTMPLAEINGKLRKSGEAVAGFVVEEIHPYHIILSDPEGSITTNSLLDR